MVTGDLLFISGTGWIAKIIKWVTKSKYSHVAVYIGEGKAIEAHAFRTVGVKSIHSYNGQYDDVSLPSIVSSQELKNALYWLYTQRGRHYSYWSDFVIFMRNVFGLIIPWREGDDIICSRLARDFLAECGLPIPDEDMSQEDLFKWISQYSERMMYR